MNSHRRGTILIVSMIIIFAIASLALTMGYNARTDMQVAANELAARQADMVERSAEQYVLGVLTEYGSSLDEITEQEMAAVPVGTGYFWVIRPNYNDKSLPAFGILDETSKLNINTATYDTLRALNGMTDQIAASIVDWRDTDSTVSENGAESADYNGLANPYNAKNADFESIDELLLIKGMTEGPAARPEGHQQPGQYLIIIRNTVCRISSQRSPLSPTKLPTGQIVSTSIMPPIVQISIRCLAKNWATRVAMKSSQSWVIGQCRIFLILHPKPT